jgi:hypothetical protein
MSHDIWFAYVLPALITIGAAAGAFAIDRRSPSSLWAALFHRKRQAGK